MADQIVVTVPEISKKADTLTTITGVSEAMAIAVGDVLLHPAAHGAEGVNWHAPTFWIILFIAAARGVMGYLTNKGTSTQVVTKQTGDNASVHVETTPAP